MRSGATRLTDNDLNAESSTIATSWLASVERTVTGLGYELVDVERAARGLLRVTIDRVPGQPPVPAAGRGGVAGAPDPAGADDVAAAEAPVTAGDAVTVEDCERVTRQLQYVLEVDGVDYQRLEVSSPGLDRPLKREADYRRFAGEPVQLTLKLPFQGRKVWRGVLQAAPDGWRLELDAGQGAQQALDFRLDEVREAHLVPVVDFKGRGRATPGGAAATPGAAKKSKKHGAGSTGAAHDAAASPASDDAGVHGGLER